MRELKEREQVESLTESDKDSVIHQPPKQVRTYKCDVIVIYYLVTFIGGRQNSYFSIELGGSINRLRFCDECRDVMLITEALETFVTVARTTGLCLSTCLRYFSQVSPLLDCCKFRIAFRCHCYMYTTYLIVCGPLT